MTTLKHLVATQRVDDRADETPHENIGQRQRDMFAKYGAAFCKHTIYSISSAIHLKASRLFTVQSAIRLVVALFGAAFVLACPPTPATAGPSEAPQAAIPPTLKIWPGREKYSFLLDDLHGNQRDLQTFAGKVVLVHFFATWCEPCVREIASLERLATTARGKQLAILAVDVAEVDLRVRAFFEKQPVDFTVLLDRDRAVSKSWDVTALPTTFVLDANLAPKLFTEGDLDWSRPDVLAAIESLYPATDRPQGKTISNK
jgi:thiol-disulfide isomerase/thioredoxin